MTPSDAQPHADEVGSPNDGRGQAPPRCDGCRICGYSGWHGSRWHNPTHFAPHIHCDCGRPCSACTKGDGFHRSTPWSPRGVA